MEQIPTEVMDAAFKYMQSIDGSEKTKQSFIAGYEYLCEGKEKEIAELKGLIKSAHYAGWYNGMVNAYKHEFSWDEFSKLNNL